ncbi:MAG: hypothetical protein Q4A66_09635, partial [Eubacteriales bacterium]|nr:hypothetical protein [Eubacteriales bacterium]
FLCAASVAVVLFDGRPAAVLEHSGEQLRIFEHAAEAIAALAQAFRSGRIFPAKRSLSIKKYPPEAAEHLRANGFLREMLDYVLERK